MRLLVAVLLGAFLANAHGSKLFLQDGMEYTYKTQTSATIGSMDYAPHSSGFAYQHNMKIQVSGNNLNIKFYDIKFTEYNGPRQPGKDWPYAEQNWEDLSVERVFQLSHNGDGVFTRMTIPSDTDLATKNVYRSWAARLQVNTAEIKAGKKAFKSREQQLQGNCDMTYTVTDQAVRKTVQHTTDCENRVFRLIDDFRGFKCSSPNTFAKGPGYPSSSQADVFVLEKKGNGYQVNAMVSTSNFIAQYFEEEGSAQIVATNMTAMLTNVQSSPGDINPSGETVTDLLYEFSDSSYTWDQSRDLKAREPFFGGGQYFEDDVSSVKTAVKEGIAFQKTILDSLDKDPATIQKAHKAGINSLLPAMFVLNYDDLMSIANELFADKSDAGVMKSNIFGELLGSTGTTAAALAVRDLVIQGKFDTDRDAARALTGVPYHIRRPNKQLVEEYDKLFEGEFGRFVEMAKPLVFGHLIRITCERAGPLKSSAWQACIDDIAVKYVNKAWDKYQSTDDKEVKLALLAGMSNMRFGGQSKVLKDVIDGKVDGDDSHLQSTALWASAWDALINGGGGEYFLPIFANRDNNHETRIFALEFLFYAKPTPAQMTAVMTVLYAEKDYEVTNYAFALMERHANNIDPCNREKAEQMQFYLKYAKQYSGYEVDWGFGVSKTYVRQFYKKKYGYGGSYFFYAIGSHKSTLPISIGMGVGQNMMGGDYTTYLAGIHLRLEGLSKALVRKFKTTDPATWKSADLEKILSGDMGIRERPDQPVRVHVCITLKGSIIFNRYYDENSAKSGGKLASFLENLRGMGDAYSINHQRAVQGGGFLYEQPTGVGLPLATLSSVTTLGHLKANIKRGNHRGLLYRDVKYNIHFFTQASRIAFIASPFRKASYGIVNDRLYHIDIPRKFVIGVNPVKKELKFSVSRPPVSKPWKIFMHSQTETVVRGHNLKGDYAGLARHCPTCQNRVLISKGPEFVKSRTFIDRTNTNVGSRLRGEYFDCEMDISRKNTVGHLLGAFMPYNKNPRTAWTSIMMGIRQTRSFFLYFPKNEQCGAMLTWSQSEENPVNEIEVSIRGDMEKNGQRLFFRGRKWLIKALIKAKGQPADRVYRVNLAYEFTPGYLENKFKLQVNRAPLPAIDMSPFSLCFALENKYPDFSEQFMGYDESSQMEVTGKAMVQYGRVASCSDAEGEIRMTFRHSTTEEARNNLKNKDYYKECQATKAQPGWSARSALPFTEACYKTVYDATSARKYSWNVNFVKLTDRAKMILSKIRTAVKAGFLPYWDVDPETIGAMDGDIGPTLNLEATLKEDEKVADVTVETRHGEETFENVPLRLNWSKRLRNLKFTKTIKRLYDAKIIKPCVLTKDTVHTNDDVDFSWQPTNCWTLVSATCGPNPSFAVFVKKTGGAQPLALKVFVGGHEVEVENGNVKINGSPVSVENEAEYAHNSNGVEIVKAFRWGDSVSLYSFLRVWVVFDGHALEVIPAPSSRGQHCGVCGNFNRNKYDDWEGKNMEQLDSAQALVSNWQWQC